VHVLVLLDLLEFIVLIAHREDMVLLALLVHVSTVEFVIKGLIGVVHVIAQ